MSLSPEFGHENENEAVIRMLSGDEELVLKPSNTCIKAVTIGDEEFVHVVHIAADGRIGRFTPDEYLLEAMQGLGFGVDPNSDVDEATLDYLAAENTHTIDGGWSELDWPELGNQ